jgi:hypothetical protein
MAKKLFLFVAVVVVVGLCGSSALALDPMGPPTAGLTQGQWSAGLDYAYSETDLEFDGKFVIMDEYGDNLYPYPFSDELVFKAVEMHKAYLNLGYGIMDGWEVFGRVGGARAEAQKPSREIYADMAGYDVYIDEHGPCHDWDTGFAIGFGTKATFWEDTNLKIGGLFQASYTKMDIRVNYLGAIDDDWWDSIGAWYVPSEGELELWELQFAVGATCELSPRFKVYGGPFFHVVDGQYKFDGSGYSIVDPYGLIDISVDGDYDVEVDSQFGGYLGAQIDVTDNVVCNAECMLTGDAIGVGTNLTWRF